MKKDSVLFKQPLATIFSLKGRLEILLKYEINCERPKEIHPLLKEFDYTDVDLSDQNKSKTFLFIGSTHILVSAEKLENRN